MRDWKQRMICTILSVAMLYSSAGGIAVDIEAAPTSESNSVVADSSAKLLSTGGVINDNQSWTLSDDGILTIKGSGTMSSGSGSWRDYADDITSVVIEEGITAIPDTAFYYLTNVTEVSIPSSVETIGARAFYRCTGLQTVNFAEGLQCIGGGAFGGCSALQIISFPKSLTKIENGAFMQCKMPVSITIPSNVSTIGAMAFSGCTGLRTIGVESGNTSFYSVNGVLFNKQNTLLAYPSGKAGVYVVPDSTTVIQRGAFYDCAGLTSVTISASVTEIGADNFCGCNNLEAITVDKNNTNFCDIDGVLYNYELTSIYTCPNQKTGTYAILPGTNTVEGYAFRGCTYLTEITVPNGVEIIDRNAFEGCGGLEHITLPNSLTKIGYRAFEGCDSLREISIPASVTYLGTGAFMGCASLQSATLPGLNQHRMGDYIFKNCTDLESVMFINGVLEEDAYITISMFEGCASLKDVSFPANLTNIREYAFMGCTSLRSLKIPEGVLTIWNGAFNDCTSLQEIALPGSLSSIQTAPFQNCTSLLSFYIADTNSNFCTIDGAIYNKDVTKLLVFPTGRVGSYGAIPSSVESLSLYGCPYLESIVIPENVNVLYVKNCPNLKSVYFCCDYPRMWDMDTQCEFPDDVTLYYIEGRTGWGGGVIANGYRVMPWTQTIVFDANGGSVTSRVATVNVGATYGELPTPTRDGYDFIGWYTEKMGGALVTEASIVHTESENVLYAHWKLKAGLRVPQVVTQPAEGISSTSAIFRADVTSDGGATVSALQFIYFEKNNPSAVYQIVADDTFSAAATNLKPSTEYWVYAQATNMAGSGYSDTVSFMTSAGDNGTKPSSVSILPNIGLTMTPGQVGYLTARVLPENAQYGSILWTSTDTSVAVVSQSGIVTAVGEGETTITAITEIGRLKANCAVRVASGQAEIDLSEWNMATNTGSDDSAGWNLAATASGNAIRAISYLSRWDGPVYESADPYGKAGYQELDPIFHTQETLFLRKRTGALDNDEIKGSIVNYGAVSASFLYSSSCYNEETCAYYNPYSIGGGHAIAIVGWDDNYSASNFRTRPAGNGAFLCKNSQGTNWGDQGYFWISYYDSQIGIRNITAVFSSGETVSNYSKIYQYDPLGPLGVMVGNTENNTPASSSWAANVFTAGHAGIEHVQAVSFYTYDKGTRYEAYIVPDWEDASSFAVLGQPCAQGVLEYAGYHTITLPNPPTVASGKQFAVVLRLTNSESGAWQYIEAPASDLPYYNSARANPGESWWSTDGTLWVDLTGMPTYQNANFCIKAFTDGAGFTNDDVQLQATLLAAEDIPSVDDYINQGVKFSEEFLAERGHAKLLGNTEETFGDEITTVPVGSSQADFLDGAQYPSSFDLRTSGDVSGVRNQGNYNTCWAHAALASMESCMLRRTKAEAYQQNRDGGFDGGFDSVIWSNLGTNVGVAGGNARTLTLSNENLTILLGSPAQLTAYADGVNTSVTWQSADPEIVRVDTGGNLTAWSIGQTVITAVSEDGKMATCVVTVTENETSTITLERQEYSCRVGDVFLLGYTLSTGNNAVVWKSSDSDVIEVDADTGRMRAVSSGSCYITATAQNGGSSALCSVRVSGLALCTVTGSKAFQKNGNSLRGSITLQVENPSGETLTAQAIIAIVDKDTGRQRAFAVRPVELGAEYETAVELTDLTFSNVPDNWSVIVYLIKSDNFSPVAIKATLS